MQTCNNELKPLRQNMPSLNHTVYAPDEIRDSPEVILDSDVMVNNSNGGGIMQMSPMVKSFVIVGVLFGLVVVLAMIHAYIEYIETQRRRKGTVIVDKGQTVRRKSTFNESQPKGRSTRTHSILYVGTRSSKNL